MQFPGEPENQKSRISILFIFLLLFNLATWLALALLSTRYRSLFPLGVLAYVFGLRHAVDADHIAAIDNTTRKLINDGQRPVGVGFFFSLGHATIVVLMALGLALTTRLVRADLPHWSGLDTMGTAVSGLFLLLIAAINLVILRDLYQLFRQVGDFQEAAKLESLLLKRGLMNRILGPLFRLIRHSWQMYPVGFLFGLGFDTVSEMALLGISAGLAGRGAPLLAIAVLPLMFAAGMTIVDTADGILMLYAYNWAFMKPVRKIYYNLTITAVSVLVALLVGGVEAMQVLSAELSFKGAFWDHLQNLDFASLGYVIISILLLSWGVAVAVYKLKGYEEKYEIRG